MDRVRAAVPCEPVLARDAAFSLDTYVQEEKIFAFFSEPPVEMVLSVREHREFHSPFRELRFSDDQVLLEKDGGFTLTAMVTPSVALTNLLLERAESVEVLSPPALRAEIAGRLRAALAAYEDAAPAP